MTPAALAALHRRCLSVPRAFSEQEFAEFLESDICFLCQADAGFALGRVVADEAELLTIAVDPDHRRSGTGRALLADFEVQSAARGAAWAFLEVAAENDAALALYRTAGYGESGRRRGYYRHPDGSREDAILMSKPLTSA